MGFASKSARPARVLARSRRGYGACGGGAGGPVERLLDDYRRYLAAERGLVAHTIENHERVARLFLAEREQLGAGLGLGDLAAQDVSAFLASECPKRSVSGARDLIKGLRGLLRYLHVAGVIPTPLQWAVPTVAFRRDHNLPLGLSRSEVARLLASCDRRRTVGRRDYAVYVAPRTMLRSSTEQGPSGESALVWAT